MTLSEVGNCVDNVEEAVPVSTLLEILPEYLAVDGCSTASVVRHAPVVREPVCVDEYLVLVDGVNPNDVMQEPHGMVTCTPNCRQVDVEFNHNHKSRCLHSATLLDLTLCRTSHPSLTELQDTPWWSIWHFMRTRFDPETERFINRAIQRDQTQNILAQADKIW